jgi:hypothetical protein
MQPVQHLAPVGPVTKAENATGQGVDAGERDNDKQGEVHVHHLPDNEFENGYSFKWLDNQKLILLTGTTVKTSFVIYKILQSLRSLRMTKMGSFAEVSD